MNPTIQTNLAKTFTANPQYANEFSELIFDINSAANKAVVKESSKTFERLSRAITQSGDNNLPNLAILKQAVKDGDSAVIRQLTEVYEKVGKRIERQNIASVRKGKPAPANFNSELDKLAKEKLGNRYPAAWEEPKACVMK